MIRNSILRLIALNALILAGPLRAGEFTLKTSDKAPPNELNASIKSKLQTTAVQVLDGDKPAFEFWFAAQLPLSSKPASPTMALDAIKPTTLIGAVSVPAARRDYRNDELAAGVYTLRFALQPQDGNHLGTSEYTYFAVLVPAKTDTKPDGISDYKALVKASSKETSSDHPVILSLRPARTDDGALPKINEPAPEHKSLRIKIPAKAGEEMTSIVFEIVCHGRAEK